MRRILLPFLTGAALFAFAEPAQAQTIGFKLGATLSKMDVDEEDAEVDTRTAFSGGGFVRFGMGRLAIQPELLFMSKGFEFQDDVGDDDLNLKLDYVEIPVLLHFPLSMGTSFAPYVFGGPSFAFEVGCEAGNDTVTVDCDEEDADLFTRKKTDVGLAAGAGLEFAMGPGNLLVEGRYTWGMTNLNDSETDETSIRNRSAFIAAGYSIPLGRRY